MKGKSLESTKSIPPMSRQAAFEPSSLNEAERTVDVVWTTGARVLRGYFDPFYEELSLDPAHVRMDRLKSGAAPFLNAHDGGDAAGTIGVVQSARLEKGRGIATVRFAKQGVDPTADMIFQKVQDGILRNISVGYRTYRSEKVEGGDATIPVYRAVDWQPYELSVVPMGADAGAVIRGAETQPNQCVFVTRQERQMDENENKTTTPPPVTESPAAAATRAATTEAIEAAKTKAAEIAAAAEKARIEERERCEEIRKIAKGTHGVLNDAWADELIRIGATAQTARDEALRALSSSDAAFALGRPRLTPGEDERAKFLRGASAWLFMRTGVRELIERAQKKNPDGFKDVSFDPGEFRGLSLYDIARMCVERGHGSVRGLDRERVVEQALDMRSGNYQTIGDFPTLLENILNKTLLGAYETQENTWQRFCLAIDVNDFRTAYRYRTGSIASLDVVPEHGEYPNQAIPDGSKYAVGTQTYGGIIGLSRQAIVNDDMGAMTQLAMEFGRAAMLSIEEAVYALLALNSGLGPTQTDSQPFFHANRANVNATGSAISEGGLDADAVVLSKQLDPSGVRYLNLRPSVLLVPRSLLSTARQIIFSPYSTASGATFQQLNIASGVYDDVVGSPYLSGTRRYTFSTARDAIVVAFLNGKGRAPVVESRIGWRIGGIEWKATLDAKAQMGDPKAAVTNAGTT